MEGGARSWSGNASWLPAGASALSLLPSVIIISPLTAFPPVVFPIRVASPMLSAHAFAQASSVILCQCQLVPVFNKLQLGCRRTVPPGGPADDQAQRPPSRQGPGPGPSQAPAAQQANGNGSGSEHHANGSQHINGELNTPGAQENGAQQMEGPPGFIPPYRGIPGYYSYGAYPGAPYDPSTQDQYLYQYNYNALHPYWRNAYLTDEDESWEERNE